MFVVIFEVQPKTERWDDYLALAKQLKPALEATDGFLDNDRFRSMRTGGRLLSLSTWRDEKAVVRWRTQGEHHGAQQRGRFEVFQDYHLRVGEVTADTQPPAGASLTQQRHDETEVGAAKAVTITEVIPGVGAGPDLARSLGLPSSAGGLVEEELFESIYNARKFLLLASWRDAAAAGAWAPAPVANAQSLRHRLVRVVRDYGMFDRREAPQFYPEVKRRN
jgi:heme-degrading monooxygenase HmoA